jgi:hypothetical protein
MIPFHFSTLFTMNIFFDYNIILLVFLLTPLPFWIAKRLTAGEEPGERVAVQAAESRG